MRTTIDRAGRLVIPRVLRERVGLLEGGEVDVELDGAEVRVRPVAGQGLVEEDGLLFIPASAGTIDDAVVRDLIDADRHPDR